MFKVRKLKKPHIFFKDGLWHVVGRYSITGPITTVKFYTLFYAFKQAKILYERLLTDTL